MDYPGWEWSTYTVVVSPLECSLPLCGRGGPGPLSFCSGGGPGPLSLCSGGGPGSPSLCERRESVAAGVWGNGAWSESVSSAAWWRFLRLVLSFPALLTPSPQDGHSGSSPPTQMRSLSLCCYLYCLSASLSPACLSHSVPSLPGSVRPAPAVCARPWLPVYFTLFTLAASV